MRIAIFCESYLSQTTAVETHLSILSRGLSAMRHEVLIVTSDLEAEECYRDKNLLLCPAKICGNFYGQSAKRSKISQLKQLIESFAPELIQVATYGEMGSVGYEYAVKHDLPLIASIHDELKDISEGYQGNRAVNLLSKNFGQALFKKVISAADLVMSSSQKIKRTVDSLSMRREITVIPLCIDTELFHLSCATQNEIDAMQKRLKISNKTGVLYVGKLTDECGVDSLLEQWAKQIKPEDGLQLVIVGDGKNLNEFSNLSVRLGIDSQVTFTGKIPHDEMGICYSACSAYVSADLSPVIKTSAIEAIACGLPAILRSGSASADLITQGVNGFYYDNFEKLAELLKKLSTIDKETKTVMKKLVSRTAVNLTPENQAKAVLECYRTAKEAHRKKR